MFTIDHIQCGMPAFYYKIEPVRHSRIERQHYVKLDGQGIDSLECATCGSCGARLTPESIRPGLKTYNIDNPEDMAKIYTYGGPGI
jgi:hypothetical protein